jgi:hypothetical protein
MKQSRRPIVLAVARVLVAVAAADSVPVADAPAAAVEAVTIIMAMRASLASHAGRSNQAATLVNA